MKLRNKKTGEILDVYKGQVLIHFNGGKETRQFKSLFQFNEEWEDYEEDPKEYYFLDSDGDVLGSTCDNSMFDDKCKSIGNFFETKEEAEKAVEKLKAWKRLKDKGFRFDGYDSGHNCNKELCGQAYFKAGNFWFDIKQDLDLLFGGEE